MAIRSPSAKKQLNEASRRLTKALRQEEDRSQQRYIKQLSPSSLKFPLWTVWAAGPEATKTEPTQAEDDFPFAEPTVFRPCEVIKIIKEHLQPRKSPGCDLITLKMLIELPLCAVGTISQLFNAMTGLLPKRWKKSIIIMIPKPGKDHTLTSSYRPISLLSCLSKLFEKWHLTRVIP